MTFGVLALAGLLLPRQVGSESPVTPRSLVRTLLPLDGVRALRIHPLLAALTWAVLPFIVALEAVNAIEVFLVKDVLGASSAQFGLSEAVAGGAAVLGALAAAAARTTQARARGIVAALGVISCCQLGQGLAPTFVVYVPMTAAVGGLLGTVNALIFTLMLTATDLDGRGRIVAFVGGASRACGVAALGFGGLLGTVAGPRASFVLIGVVGLLIAVAAIVAVRGRLPKGEDAMAPGSAGAPPGGDAPASPPTIRRPGRSA